MDSFEDGADPDLTEEELARLAALDVDDEGNIAHDPAYYAEVERYQESLRPADERIASRYSSKLTKKSTTFNFTKLVEALLTPELAHAPSNEVAEALLEVTHAQLNGMRIDSCESLVCLTNITHLYLSDNCLASLEGIEFMLQLRVLTAARNQVTTTEAISDLSELTFLDLRENQLSDLDVDQLPVSLKVLNLKGNPCAPNYGDASFDEQYATSYREILLERCPSLVSLDDDQIAEGESVLRTLAKEANPGQDKASAGLQANVAATDFVHGNEAANDGASEIPMDRGTPVTEGASDNDADDGDEKPSKPGSSGSAPTSKRSATASHVDANGAALQVEPGVSSQIGQITDDLVGRYVRMQEKKSAKVDEVVDDTTLVTASNQDDHQATEEELSEISDQQRELRNELRKAHDHHSRLASSSVAAVWSESGAELLKCREDVASRRQDVEERLSKPSASYLRALERIKAARGVDDLDKYRATPGEKTRDA